MLTLLKGKARKSVYFAKFYNSTPDSILIQYDQNVHMVLSAGKTSYVYERRESTKTDILELEADLIEIVNEVMEKNYKHLFLYANFHPHEVEVLKNIVYKIHPLLDVTVTIQDNSVLDGQIVIEEIQ